MTAHVESGASVRPMYGERVSGDAAFVVEVDGGLLAVIIDVLGHGEEANELAVRMQDYLSRQSSGDVVDVMSRLHEKFRGSRGAAVGLCMIESATGRLRYTGVGNTVIRRFGETETRLVSRDGVVGSTMRKPVEEGGQLSDGDVVVMYTDGVKAHFSGSDYPRLRMEQPHLVAANIIHWFGKSHDDASCVVMRYRR
jgi:serine phosphatase RsbU (regulator of sigma subunit)